MPLSSISNCPDRQAALDCHDSSAAKKSPTASNWPSAESTSMTD
jgi:hypothetical protein